MSSGLAVKIIEMVAFRGIPTNTSWITERLAIDSFEEFGEMIERGRFAFSSNDITLSHVNNYDGYFDYFPNKYCGERPFLGITVEIYWDGTIEYLGYVRSLDDLEFDDEKKTVDIHCYSWQKRLADIGVDDFSYSGSIEEMLEYIWARIYATPHPSPTFSGIRQELTGIYCPSAKINMGQFDDVWWDGRSERWWGIKWWWNSDGGHLHFDLYEIFNRQNAHKIVDDIVLSFNFEADVINVHFVPAIIGMDYFGVWARVENYATGEEAQLAIFNASDGSGVVFGVPCHQSGVDGWHKVLIKSGDIFDITREFTESVWADFEHYYFVRSAGSADHYHLWQYTLGSTSGTIICEINTAYNPKDIVFMPNTGLVFWRVSSASTQYKYAYFASYPIIYGTTSEMVGSMATMTYGYAIPLGYTDIDSIGKYFIWRIGVDVIDGRVQYDFYTTDVNFTHSLELAYNGKVTFEEILNDIVQLCDGNLYVTPDGYINLYDKGKARNNHGVSLEYVNKQGRRRNYKDLRLAEPSLQIKTPLTDNPDDPYDTTTIKGILRTYYRDRLQEVWIIWRDEIPLRIGKTFYLGDSITEYETGNTGIISERRLSFQNGKRMVEFTLERTLE